MPTETWKVVVKGVQTVSVIVETCHVDSVDDTFNGPITRVPCSIGFLHRVWVPLMLISLLSAIICCM